MKVKLMAAAALVAMGGVAQAQLVNGGFETPDVSGFPDSIAIYGDLADVGGWTVTGCAGGACATDAVALVNNLNPLSGYTTPYGNQWLDLTGDSNAGFSSVSQTFGGLVVGQLYTLSFALGATTFNDALVNVSVGGVSGNFTTPATTGAGLDTFTNNWLDYSLNFTATATSTTLTFAGVAPAGYPVIPGVSIGIDNIAVVTAVPEPSAYAMALAGLGALGFLARRRKSRA